MTTLKPDYAVPCDKDRWFVMRVIREFNDDGLHIMGGSAFTYGIGFMEAFVKGTLTNHQLEEFKKIRRGDSPLIRPYSP